MKRYASLLLLLLLLLSSAVHASGTASHLPKNQSEILRSLSNHLPASSTGRSWDTADPNPCLWAGITCSPGPSSRVTHLSLSGLGLSPANASSAEAFFRLLCRLDSLRSLDLSQNLFSSFRCSGLPGLKSLNLSSNMLTGPLPSLSGFPALESLDLSYNRFDGIVGAQFDGVPNLRSLDLSFNLLTGSIPARVGGLQELVLSGNHFNGRIPDEISRLGNLTLLDLRQNDLSGSVPHWIGGLPKLETLLLSANNLTGEIPGELAKIKTLSRFAANQNGFTGAIPAGITGYLQVLDLSYNSLSGEIPPDLLSPPTLESVDLTFNLLSGHIPKNLSKKLYRLRFGGNKLNGSIPPAIGELSRLTYLELDDNDLDAGIPPQLERCTNLALLNLASNRLQGALPKELGGLHQLVVMKLQMNNLSGEIPTELFKLANLSTLNLSWNSLTGAIPSAISSLQKLSVLNLEYNDLNGSLPNTISSLRSLIELQLGHNKLSGTVPRMPTTLGTALNLSSNLFSGPIPLYLADMLQLEILDLSNNSFTGEVPSSFTQMAGLTQLVLSNNQLSGVLPKFNHWVVVITTGNEGLVQENTSSPTTSPKRKKPPILIIVVATIGAFVGSGFVAAIIVVLVSKRFYRVEDGGLEAEENPLHIINGCLLTTNSIHTSSINFTKAMEAVGNPGNIMLKTRFSTYYKAVMPSGACYSVKKLNCSDKIFSVGSHGRFGRELEALGRLSSSNVMVPLAYVLTEDSAYLFYEHIHKGTVFDFLHKGSKNALDWPSRYSIALGVAQGLAFIHGCSQPVLLLDLTTKSIHLKSVKEPQIGDIELCKVIDPSKSTGSLSTVAGSVGYIPPEYAYTMRVTAAGNVYSFGVILLELLTGKPPVSEGIELAKSALSCSARLDEREQFLDPRLRKTSLAVRSQMLSVFKVAVECVRLSPGARPKMRNVLRMLFNAQ